MRNKEIKKKRRASDNQLKKCLPGLNLQAPWTQWILEGRKTVETRFYPLPKKYVGKEMLIIETPGKTGKFKARIVGIVVFGEPFQYQSKKEFYADRARHLVDTASPNFTWESGKGKKKWGWPVGKTRRMYIKLPIGIKRGILYTESIPIGP